MYKELKILVTAGDTYENIDDVRRVTHMATGRLGSLIANEFAKKGAEVTYLCGERSDIPNIQMKEIVKITGVMSLKKEMERLLRKTSFDAVIHSMAVSDYVFRGLALEDDIIDEVIRIVREADTPVENSELRKKIKHSINNAMPERCGKISSDLTSIAIFMDRAPKVISSVKKIQPKTILVGFKLLSHVSEETLLQAARMQMIKSGSDFVFANDLSTINKDGHSGTLIGREGIIDRIDTKQDIAKSIVLNVIKEVKKKKGVNENDVK